MQELKRGETFIVDGKYIDKIVYEGIAHDCFGRVRRVTKVFAHDLDINGKEFVCYYTEFGPSSQISHSVKIEEEFDWIGKED